MEPTLRDGDRLLVRYDGAAAVGRLAVVRLPHRPLAVKRLTRREPDGWWVERDNPAEGVDSWLVGAISDRDVVAVVVCPLWRRPRRRQWRRRMPPWSRTLPARRR